MFLYIIKRFNGKISIKTTNDISKIKINKDSVLYDVYSVDSTFKLKTLGDYLGQVKGIVLIKNTNYLIQLQYSENIKDTVDRFFSLILI